MTNFENAQKFFHACESIKGWDACTEFVAEGATFGGQCEPLIEIKTVKGYVDWMTGLGNITAPGCTYQLHSSSYDEEKNTALFFATYTLKHTGEGGPVPPTNKTANADYVYSIRMDNNGKITGIIKIWNAAWTLGELGWM